MGKRAGGAWDDEDWGTPGEARGAPPADEDEWTGPVGRGPSPKAKAILALVLGLAMLGSFVLCCAAAGRVGQLLQLELPLP